MGHLDDLDTASRAACRNLSQGATITRGRITARKCPYRRVCGASFTIKTAHPPDARDAHRFSTVAAASECKRAVPKVICSPLGASALKPSESARMKTCGNRGK